MNHHQFPSDIAKWTSDDFRAFEIARTTKSTIAISPALQAEIAAAQAELDLEERERALRAPGGVDAAVAIFGEDARHAVRSAEPRQHTARITEARHRQATANNGKDLGEAIFGDNAKEERTIRTAPSPSSRLGSLERSSQ